MSTASLHNCPAPAKLNLFLHVVGRRADGYHLLQSVFQLIERGDTLHFDLRDDGRIRRTNDVPGVPEASDLIVRALGRLADAYQRRHGRAAPGIDVTIDKILPMGGGLGGGSSDAATALMAANHLWQAGFSDAELMEIGLPLGADIPFFIYGQTAFVEGVGEAMQPIAGPDCWYVVIEPGVSVPTPAIFTAEDLTRDTKPITIADFPAAHLINEFGKNDLQAVASRLFPPVAQAIEWLGQYGAARMTGSGACVFCAVPDEAQADRVVGQVPSIWRAWKARSLQRHPMKSLLQNTEL
ncbi:MULTISPECIES: 4-(cytidine 5'-diphospho)-2-C-methyl-D-erythritol kinase [unclassified Massilia]|uniref:4-(cytidine 5'-diphospho)-2-C-methyl-D-erythritol kinase n=1 Tax=unclassified Massilia TaxID=2609279 RepID=UPI0017821743|nr:MULTISPECIES: 4-(cytidine 5'-diphospho)-2-C-methyl-D-erythritol kinase [unclassified Massilia]MBD8529736.1 4-(cytidine 5'-diphospho)-2-C-methyl-D-erythritol kinase [Massilia sp. CFBP 13647]MBD8673177.1 4-(cytidine 5'-diphospho)-2-C-methyl-D-erythritol kinase [Massilia sp. CFBP 13721]